jgi:hypothetical protein
MYLICFFLLYVACQYYVIYLFTPESCVFHRLLHSLPGPEICSAWRYVQSRRGYRPAEGRVEARRRQRPGQPTATTNRFVA